MRPGLLRHPKFARLSRLIGSEPTALGHLELLWSVGYENGDDNLGDAGDVEFLARWTGETGALAAALVSSGFIDRDDAGVHRIHDLWDHAPEYVRKRRAREVERREKGDTLRTLSAERRPVSGQCPPDGGQCPPNGGQCPPNGKTPTPAPAPAPKKKEHCPPPEPPEGTPGTPGTPDPAAAVLQYLNDRKACKPVFRPTEGNLRGIRARLAAGATPDDCRAVIDAKVREWGAKPEMRRNLNPETLFRPSHWDRYLDEALAARSPTSVLPRQLRSDLDDVGPDPGGAS